MYRAAALLLYINAPPARGWVEDRGGTLPAPLHTLQDRKRVAGSRALKATPGSGEGTDTSSDRPKFS